MLVRRKPTGSNSISSFRRTETPLSGPPKPRLDSGAIIRERRNKAIAPYAGGLPTVTNGTRRVRRETTRRLPVTPTRSRAGSRRLCRRRFMFGVIRSCGDSFLKLYIFSCARIDCRARSFCNWKVVGWTATNLPETALSRHSGWRATSSTKSKPCGPPMRLRSNARLPIGLRI
jgi:hypothetical protein